VERIATLLGAGYDLRAAVEHVVATGGGPVVAELASVATQLARGAPAAAAVRSWARRMACPHLAQLAADLRGCADVGEMTAAFERRAHLLRRAVVGDQLRTLRRRTAVVWVAAMGACGTTVAFVVA
jgi:Flp pilus assembly protein TadB